jgi:hypothetical protein
MKKAIAEFVGFLIALAYTVHFHATCDGDVVRGNFGLVCLEDK